ncbi:MAG: SLC13/DASS family transporter [Rhodothermaceae bacterium]|nr:SLC13/DASS family transporter [Rhodothermaceae bacterium]MXZ58289.1 SLC13/DASS family transporter [Rhodothermaceae bacterium]MYB92050.1 SLC13/DASS family transporter [Rhodothermaceae bacterium]MYD67975.1 SLC13/DASS family transporter [Rhodothermaceae bacterium]MYG44094.1 SLC13/DASS family transporter [Rhodothermaceae bacterium]
MEIPSSYGIRQYMGLFLGPFWLIIVFILPPPDGLAAAAWYTAGIALLMATWWICESIPIPATSLLPLVLFPILGVRTAQETAEPYAHPIIFLFMGGFMIALSMMRWGLHRRIAMWIIARVGTGPRALIAGFMIATAGLSMWVSNTATTLMMLPVALSVIALVDTESGSERFKHHFAVALLLGVAYAANIGGMGTLIGTIPNAFISAFFESEYGYTITFTRWFSVGAPIVLIGVPLVFFMITKVLYSFAKNDLVGSADLIERERGKLGPVKKGERIVGIVFLVTALLWITRPLLITWIPGLTDAGIAMIGGLSLFVIPVDFKRGIFTQDWETAKQLPWGALILIGGGLSLAGAVSGSGLAVWLGESLEPLQRFPTILIILMTTGIIVFLTEITSNAATTATFLPVLAALALAVGENPLLMAIPAALAASCAFMLPVATPPNAIVYGSGRVTVFEMARAGLALNFAFLLLITICAYSLILWVFRIETGTIPGWAM